MNALHIILPILMVGIPITIALVWCIYKIYRLQGRVNGQRSQIAEQEECFNRRLKRFRTRVDELSTLLVRVHSQMIENVKDEQKREWMEEEFGEHVRKLEL